MTGTPLMPTLGSITPPPAAAPARPRLNKCGGLTTVRAPGYNPTAAVFGPAEAVPDSAFELGDSEPDITSATPKTQLYEPRELFAAQALLKELGNDDHGKRDRRLLDALVQSSWHKPLMPIPDDFEAILSNWRVSFPNAESVFDLLQESCALAVIDDRVLRMPPMVIEGPPGCGKTFIAEEIGRAFGGGFARVAMAGMEMGSELGGSDPSWSNTRVGKVFDALVYGAYANPVFQLDEIDKATGDPRFDPYASLHDLLESASAQKFRDRSFDRVALNASHIVWIATANDVARIPEAIRSRLTSVVVEMPSASQVPAIVDSVMRRLQQDRPVLRRFTLADDVAPDLHHESPRSMRLLLGRACARAAQEGTVLVSARHLPAERSVGAVRARRIGF